MGEEKPSGPIFIDMSEALMGLAVKDLVRICNVALNRMSLGELAETAFLAGLDINFNMVDPTDA